jgi:hypothetical protein
MYQKKLLSVSAKGFFTSILVFGFSLGVFAQDGIIVAAESGTTTSVSFSNVYKLNFVNETMTIVNAAGVEGQSFSLASTHSIVFGRVDVSGLNEKEMNPLLKVYPTTTKDLLYVNNAIVGNYATVFSITGSKVIDVKVTDSNQSINVNMLQNGVYILKVDGATFKFNKQ